MCRLMIVFIFFLTPFIQTLAVAQEKPFTFVLPAPPPQQHSEQQARIDHIYTAGPAPNQIGMVFPQLQDDVGMLPPSIAAAPIDPRSAPSQYKVSAIVAYNYGVSLYNAGKVLQAREEWKTALRFQPTLSEGQYALSLLSHLHGNEEDAINYAFHAKLHKSDWAAAFNHLGMLYYENGKVAQASEHFLESLRLEPNNPIALNGLGLSKLREGLLPEAKHTLTMATASNPNLPHSHHNLGLTFFALREWEKAGKHFEETLKLDPTLDRTHFWVGMTYAAIGKWTQAISSWQRAVAYNPNHYQIHLIYFNLGTAYWMTGNPIEAQQAYQIALTGHPIWPQAYYQMGVINMALSQWDMASEHFLTAIQLAPEWEQPYFNLGLVRYNQGLLEEAFEAFQQAVTLQPDSSDAQYHLGLALRIKQQHRRALLAFEHAAQAGHVKAQEMLAGMYANGRGTTRDLTQAMRWWHRASRGHPVDPSAGQARAKLSRLRQLYFLQPDNHAYTREILEGFHAIQSDMWNDYREMHRNMNNQYRGTSIGINLATSGHLIEAIPVLVSEAYTLNLEAHRYLELLFQEGALNKRPLQHAQVMKYFTQTASEGSSDSCRFLTLVNSPPKRNGPRLQLAQVETASCQASIP